MEGSEGQGKGFRAMCLPITGACSVVQAWPGRGRMGAEQRLWGWEHLATDPTPDVYQGIRMGGK